jgi:hypothetical protein
MVNNIMDDRLFGLALAAIFASALLLNALSY